MSGDGKDFADIAQGLESGAYEAGMEVAGGLAEA